MDTYLFGVRMWSTVGYQVSFDVDIEGYEIPEGSEYFSEGENKGFVVEKGTVIMFGNGDIIFYTGAATEIIHCIGVKEIKIKGVAPYEEIFWRKYPVPDDQELDEGDDDEK